jgi:Kef-type K+ transport system membrane component KefB
MNPADARRGIVHSTTHAEDQEAYLKTTGLVLPFASRSGLSSIVNLPDPSLLSPMLTLGAASDLRLAYDLFIILGTAAVVAIILQRLRLAVVPAYIIAGAIVGPSGFALVDATDMINGINHFAVLLLLFGIGMHIDVSVLKREFTPMVTAGVGSVLVSVLVGVLVLMAFRLDSTTALVIAMALSLSSTAVVMRILFDRRELRHPHGRLAFAILIVQDLLVVIMLASIPLMAELAEIESEVADAANATGLELKVVLEFIIKIVAVAAVLVIGFFAIPKLLAEAVGPGNRDVVAIFGLAVACGTAAALQWLGFSGELGAFLAGLMLSSTPFRHQLAALLSGVRDILMAVFFTSVGMKLSLGVVFDAWPIVLLGGLVMTMLKSIIIAGSSWMVGAAVGSALMVGFSLGQAGEFSLVLLDRGEEFGLIDDATVDRIAAVVVLSLIFTPALVRLGTALMPRLNEVHLKPPWIPARHAPSSSETESTEAAKRIAIVAGYGTVGQAAVYELETAGYECTIVELNAFTVRRLLAQQKNIIYGDISNPEIQEAADVTDAKLLVITVPDDDAAVAAVGFSKQQHPHVRVAVRTHFPGAGERARAAGADIVVVDETATASEMLQQIKKIDSPPGTGQSSSSSNTVDSA